MHRTKRLHRKQAMRTARRRTQERRRVDTNRESSVYPTVSSQEKEKRYGAGRVVPGKPSRGTDTDRVVVRRMRPVTYSNLSSPFAPPRRASAVHLRLVSPGSRRVRPLQAPATRTLAPAAAGAVSAAPEPPRGEGPGRAGETLRQVHATGQTRDPGHCRATHPRLDHRATAHDRFPARL